MNKQQILDRIEEELDAVAPELGIIATTRCDGRYNDLDIQLDDTLVQLRVVDRRYPSSTFRQVINYDRKNGRASWFVVDINLLPVVTDNAEVKGVPEEWVQTLHYFAGGRIYVYTPGGAIFPVHIEMLQTPVSGSTLYTYRSEHGDVIDFTGMTIGEITTGDSLIHAQFDPMTYQFVHFGQNLFWADLPGAEIDWYPRYTTIPADVLFDAPELDYHLLGLERGADRDAVKAAYREKARQLHPDTNHDKDAAQKMQQINAAYDRIKKARGW